MTIEGLNRLFFKVGIRPRFHPQMHRAAMTASNGPHGAYSHDFFEHFRQKVQDRI